MTTSCGHARARIVFWRWWFAAVFKSGPADGGAGFFVVVVVASGASVVTIRPRRRRGSNNERSSSLFIGRYHSRSFRSRHSRSIRVHEVRLRRKSAVRYSSRHQETTAPGFRPVWIPAEDGDSSNAAVGAGSGRSAQSSGEAARKSDPVNASVGRAAAFAETCGIVPISDGAPGCRGAKSGGTASGTAMQAVGSDCCCIGGTATGCRASIKRCCCWRDAVSCGKTG